MKNDTLLRTAAPADHGTRRFMGAVAFVLVSMTLLVLVAGA